MQRNRDRLFRFTRCESDKPYSSSQRHPTACSPRRQAVPPCSSQVESPPPIAACCPHELRHLRGSEGRPLLCLYWQAFERSCGIALNNVLSNLGIERGTYNFHGKIGCPCPLARCDDRIAVSEYVFRGDVRARGLPGCQARQ